MPGLAVCCNGGVEVCGFFLLFSHSCFIVAFRRPPLAVALFADIPAESALGGDGCEGDADECHDGGDEPNVCGGDSGDELGVVKDFEDFVDDPDFSGEEGKGGEDGAGEDCDDGFEHEGSLGVPAGGANHAHDFGFLAAVECGDLHHVDDEEDGCECLDCGEEEGGVADGVKVAGGVTEVVDLVDDGCYLG